MLPGAQGGALYAYGEASMGQLGCGDGGEAETPFPRLATPEVFKGSQVHILTSFRVQTSQI